MHWITNYSSANVCSPAVTFPNGDVLTISNLQIHAPSYQLDGKVHALTPAKARKDMMTYSNDWYVDLAVHDKDGVLKETTNRPMLVGSIPTMVKSKCTLHGLSAMDMSLRGEDPMDPGGFFIVSGHEYTLMYLEKLDINKIQLVVNKKTKDHEVILRLPRHRELVASRFHIPRLTR